MSELKTHGKYFFSVSITPEQSKDTGLAMALILLIVGLFTNNLLIFKLVIPVLLLVMTLPGWFYPLAVVWFGLSHLIGTLMSWIILTIVYLIIVLPVALVRKMAGIDNLRLGEFKKETGSVMLIRNHVFKPSDMEKPY
jgi:hypothetical protein